MLSELICPIETLLQKEIAVWKCVILETPRWGHSRLLADIDETRLAFIVGNLRVGGIGATVGQLSDVIFEVTRGHCDIATL